VPLRCRDVKRFLTTTDPFGHVTWGRHYFDDDTSARSLLNLWPTCLAVSMARRAAPREHIQLEESVSTAALALPAHTVPGAAAVVLAAESEDARRVQVVPTWTGPTKNANGTDVVAASAGAGSRTPSVSAGTDSSTSRRGGRWWPSAPRPGTRAFTVLLAYQTLGIIYGDIGTSPLYAFTALFPAGVPPAPEDVLEGLSCMIWTILLVVVVKYVGLVLLADDHGEGGTFAIYSLLSRLLRDQIKDRARYRWVNRVLAIMSIVGVAAVLSDGILTPAISVLSAVGGIKVAAPGLSQGGVAGVAAVILTLLMLGQRFGTSRVAFLFSPIVLLWFIAIMGIGIYYIAQVPGIFAAFSPHYAIRFFLGTGYTGFTHLGAIVLVVTGAEALFADLGHFSAAAIRLSALCFVVPALLLAYLGQGAALVVDYNALVSAGWVPGTTDFPPGKVPVVDDIFYQMLPSSLLIPFVILATFASIIASQALITASFSLVQQATRLHMFPRVTIIHTDAHHAGQIYIPEVNYALLVAILVVVAVAQDSEALAAAYGVTVTLVFVLTTLFYTVAIVVRFHRHWVWAALFCVFFLPIDVAFLAANLIKFTSGAWFTVLTCTVLTVIMVLWRWGRLRMLRRQGRLSAPDAAIFGTIPGALLPASDAPDADAPPLASYSEAGMPSDLKTAAVAATAAQPLLVLPKRTMLCYTSVTDAVPGVYVHFLRQLPVRPARLFFITLTSVNVPRVEDNLVITPLPGVPVVGSGETLTGVWRVHVTYGYAEPVPHASRLALRLARTLGILPDPSAEAPTVVVHTADLAPADKPVTVATPPTDLTDADAAQLEALAPTYLLGTDAVVPEPGTGAVHRALVVGFALLLRTSRSATDDFHIPTNRRLEIGMHVAI
jgi:KUP system potassium uptake protein